MGPKLRRLAHWRCWNQEGLDRAASEIPQLHMVKGGQVYSLCFCILFEMTVGGACRRLCSPLS